MTGKSVAGFLLAAATAAVFVVITSRMAWDTFNPSIRHDGDTLFFGQYIRNLVRYPLSETYGLMANLVGDKPSQLIVGARRTFYGDHPMGVIWISALVHWLFIDNALLAGRWTNIISVALTISAVVGFVFSRLGLRTALFTALVILTIPLLWEHAPVIGLQAMPLAFTFAATIAFVGYFRSSSRPVLVAATILWVLAMLCDWPGYLLGGPIALSLLQRRSYVTLAMMVAVGCGTMALVLAHQVIAFNFQVGEFMVATFRPFLSDGPTTLPTGSALLLTFNYAFRAFGMWTMALVLPFLIPRQNRLEGQNIADVHLVFRYMLFVGLANNVIFAQWSATHSYWSFFLIPSVCLGMAITLQWIGTLSQTWIKALSVLMVLVVAATNMSRAIEFTSGSSYFVAPMPISLTLGALGLQALLDPETKIFVDPKCSDESKPQYPVCSIYFGQGYFARYLIDKPGIPARNEQVSDCSSSFFIMDRDPNQTQYLRDNAINFRDVDVFDWTVVSGADLPPAFCGDPRRVFLATEL